MSNREFWCAAYLAALRGGSNHYAQSCADAAVAALKLRTAANFEPPEPIMPHDAYGPLNEYHPLRPV